MDDIPAWLAARRPFQDDLELAGQPRLERYCGLADLPVAPIARDYPIGSAGRMVPCYFPTALSTLLMGLGAYILVNGLGS